MHTSTLQGRTALVTGAGRGIGRGIALHLARAGCRVVVNDRHSAGDDSLSAAAGGPDDTADQIRGLGAEADVILADVSRPADVHAMVEAIVARYGRLDILVNNAGVQTFKPFLDVTESEWDLVIATNLK